MRMIPVPLILSLLFVACGDKDGGGDDTAGGGDDGGTDTTEATDADGSARWVVDDGGAPCPDCDDNALAGPVPHGSEFPTGDLHPPAHPGCRCLAAPAA